MRSLIKCMVLILGVQLVNGCSSATSPTLYDELGGKTKIHQIVTNFVSEIEYNEQILPYFAGSDIDRFIQKLSEQICAVSDGPCVYSGDDMQKVHAGMNITEAHFNLTVDLLINAMNDADIPHTTQNKLLARLAPTRADMLYQ